MLVCTFFGHRDAPQEILPRLRAAVALLIEQGTDTFYVGNQGNFDRMVRAVLREQQALHPSVRWAVVLAYLPTAPCEYPTVYPEGVENSPPRFAIDARNRWMLAQSDIVVTYVCRSYGGAATNKRRAQRQGKRVIELAEQSV